MLTLHPVRDFGKVGISRAELEGTVGDETNPLRLPPIEVLILYKFLTAEEGATGRIEVRLWITQADAVRYLAEKERRGGGGTLFAVVTSKPVDVN